MPLQEAEALLYDHSMTMVALQLPSAIAGHFLHTDGGQHTSKRVP